MNTYLTEIINNLDIYVLIVIRMIGFFVIVPVIGGNWFPARMKIAFAVVVAAILYSGGAGNNINYVDSIPGYAILIMQEFFVGFTMGFVIFFFFNALYLAGQMTDQQIGLSMAAVYDPMTQTQIPITGKLYYYAFCTMLIITGGHRMLVSTLFYSYKAIPIGNANIIGNVELFDKVMSMFNSFFLIGAGIALPIIGVILVLDVALGILVKTAPKINVFVVGMPLKVFIGFIAIWIIIPLFSDVFNSIYATISDQLLTIIKVMMP